MRRDLLWYWKKGYTCEEAVNNVLKEFPKRSRKEVEKVAWEMCRPGRKGRPPSQGGLPGSGRRH